MILSLNLIPPGYKEQFRLQRVFTLLRNIIVAIIFYTIFLALIILLARYVLQGNFNRIVNETTLVTQTNRDTERNIIAFNREIKIASLLEDQAFPWPEFLIHFSKLFSPEVRLTNLKLEPGTQRAAMVGTATTRTALLAFKDTLEQASYLKDVTLPVTDLLAKTNVNFTITFTVDLSRLSTP